MRAPKSHETSIHVFQSSSCHLRVKEEVIRDVYRRNLIISDTRGIAVVSSLVEGLKEEGECAAI